MNREEILSHVDHTLLKPEATWPQIQTLCDEAIANHTASVCINTCYVKQADAVWLAIASSQMTWIWGQVASGFSRV